jgi:hypothetical protein
MHMAKEPDFDVMGDLDAMTDEAEESDEAMGLDAELLEHAKAAGLTEAQAEALKLFVERCHELEGEGEYDDAEADLDGDEGDEEF